MTLIGKVTHYYKLDEASGDAIDSEGSLDGTINNVTQGVTGKINDAYEFDGTGDYIGLSSAMSGGTHILTIGHDGGAASKLCVYDGTSWREGTFNLTANVWQHVGFTADGSNIRMYVDGDLKDTIGSSLTAQSIFLWVYPNDLSGSHGTLTNRETVEAIGARGGPSSEYDGTMDEIYVADGATLTQTEITELYNSGDGLTYPFTVGTNIQININDVWKEVPAVKINIGDVWKDVVGAQINIGDTWKEVF